MGRTISILESKDGSSFAAGLQRRVKEESLHLQRNTNRTRTEDLKHAVRWERIKTCLLLSSWCSITVFLLCWTCNDICAQGLTTAVLMAQRANPMHSIPYNPNMSNQKHPISHPTHTYTALSVSEFKLAINSWMLCLMNNTKYPWGRAWWNPALCFVLQPRKPSHDPSR